jgi:hypothetical protein
MIRATLPALLLLASCSVGQIRSVESAPRLQPMIQGYLGISKLEDEDYDLEPAIGEVVDSDLEELPLLGFAYMRPLAGERVHIGFELGSSWAFEGDRMAIETQQSTVVLADNDLLLGDIFLGLNVSTMLGERARLYAGVGPLLQYGRIELEFDDGSGGYDQIEESGWGSGAYARMGIEFKVSPGTYVGLTVRHKDVTVGLDDDIDELEFESDAVMLSVSRHL